MSLRRSLTAVAVAALALVVTSPPAAAAPPTDRATPPAASVTLTSQPAWTPIGGDARLHLAVTGPSTTLELRVIVHQAVTTRIGFDRTLAGQSLGGTVARLSPVAVDQVPADETGQRVLTLGLQDPSAARDPARIPIRRTGVYPVEVELRNRSTAATVARFVTYLVVVGSTVGTEPLSVAWIWRMVARPALTVDGQPDPKVAAQLQPHGRLGRMATALSHAADVPVTIAPGPETLEAWTKLGSTDPSVRAGADAVTAAAKNHQVLAGSYVPVDIPALDSHGLGSEVAAQLAQGADALGSVLGVRIDPRTALVDRLDAAALARLREAGVDRLVVEPETLQPVTNPLTPARPFDIESEGRTFRAAAADTGLSRLLETADPPALRAQRLLAGLALVASEKPSEARGIMLTSSSSWDPPQELLDAVVSGLRGHPLLKATSVDTFLESVPVATTGTGGPPVVRQLLPATGGNVPVSTQAYRDAQHSLDSFRSLIGSDDPRLARGERALLVSLSSVWTGASGRKRAAEELFVINAAALDFLSKISVPDGRAITLTARSASIPISFTNNTGRTVSVRVRLSSNKLLFPEGAERKVDLPPKTRTVEFKVTTRASGTFPVLITVTSTDGGLEIQTARLTVRSTVVSGVGLFLTIGAVLFLAAWWVNHFRRNRRTPRRLRRGHPSPVPGPAGDPA